MPKDFLVLAYLSKRPPSSILKLPAGCGFVGRNFVEYLVDNDLCSKVSFFFVLLLSSRRA